MHSYLNFITAAGVANVKTSQQSFRKYVNFGGPQRVCSRQGRRASAGVQCATALMSQGATAQGRVAIYPSPIDVAVGDTLRVEYDPPEGIFAHVSNSNSAKLLFWAGGFNDWNGDEEDETLLFPMIPLEEGRYRVSVCVPDYAKSVVFGFTDESGFAWDTNDGKYFRIPIRFQKRYNAKEEVVEEFEASNTISMDLKRESASPPVLDVAEERNLHKIRGEATMVGEEKGLGNIHISQARDTFDRYDTGRKGFISISNVASALEVMGFDLPQSRVADLVSKFVSGDKASMTEFMLLYAELELDDEGIDIV
jgi:hypothetical protein